MLKIHHIIHSKIILPYVATEYTPRYVRSQEWLTFVQCVILCMDNNNLHPQHAFCVHVPHWSTLLHLRTQLQWCGAAQPYTGL